MNAFKPFLYKIAGIAYIVPEDCKELLKPFIALLFICSDKGIHGKKVHSIVMTQ